MLTDEPTQDLHPGLLLFEFPEGAIALAQLTRQCVGIGVQSWNPVAMTLCVPSGGFLFLFPWSSRGVSQVPVNESSIWIPHQTFPTGKQTAVNISSPTLCIRIHSFWIPLPQCIWKCIHAEKWGEVILISLVLDRQIFWKQKGNPTWKWGSRHWCELVGEEAVDWRGSRCCLTPVTEEAAPLV